MKTYSARAVLARAECGGGGSLSICVAGCEMSDNSTDFGTMQPVVEVTSHNFPALLFGIFLIIFIIGGNVLVCLSVYMEKALKTTTNYFIVSLAIADLLLAVLVLPLFVYAEVRTILTQRLF